MNTTTAHSSVFQSRDHDIVVQEHHHHHHHHPVSGTSAVVVVVVVARGVLVEVEKTVRLISVDEKHQVADL